MFQNNLLMGAAAAASGGGASVVSVGNSALYNASASESLTRTEVTGTSNQKQYLSFWMYVNKLAFQALYACDDGGGSNRTLLYLNTDGSFAFYDTTSSVNKCILETTQLLRDVGWYNIELLLDTTQAVAANRNILRINGERVTVFDLQTNFTLNQTLGGWGTSGRSEYWGRYYVTSYNPNVYLAETVRIDGDPSGISASEYDSTGLYWTPKSSTVIKAFTFGNNGYYLDNTTNAQTDASGEGNNFTNNGSIATSTHTPTNLKPLLNQLNSSTNTTLSNGNQSFVNSAANNIAFGTIPLPSTGKWYFEYKLNNASSASIVHVIGLMKLGNPAGWTSGLSSGFSDFSSCYLAAAQQIWQDGSLLNSPSTGAGSINDILSLAVDLDNTKMWIGYNNSFYNASGGTDGNPATGANAMSTKNFSDNYGIIVGLYSSQGTIQFDTADFTYTPPSGYLALNSTNLTSETTRTASDTTKYFETTVYEGNGAGQRVGNFQPFDNSFTVAKSALVPATGGLSRTFDEAGNRQIFSLSTWFKIGQTGEQEASLGVALFTTKNGSANSESTWFAIRLNTVNQLVLSIWDDLITTRTFDDTSQWYHLLVAVDTTQGASADRIKIYINGVQETSFATTNYPSSSASLAWGVDSTAHYVGIYNDGSISEWNGYLAQTAYITGTQLTPSSFGQTDTSTNRWIPKDISGLTFGSAGFFLDYADSDNLGDDESGNTNDFTNINSVAQVADSPTTNIATLNPNYDFSSGTFSNGNRNIVTGSSQYGPALGTLGVDSGKWYCEIKPTADTAGTLFCVIGISRGLNLSTTNNLGVQLGDYGYYSYGSGSSTGTIVTDTTGVGATYGASYTIDDIMGMALDLDNKTLTFYKNNSSQGVITGLMDGMYYPAMGDWNNSGSTTFEVRFDSSLWSYSAPTDHKALVQDNMPDTDQFISAFSWIKNRDATDNHMLFDRVRGVNKDIHSNATSAQVTNVNTLQSFLAGGVQIGNDVEVNTANESYVLWDWMIESTGSGSSNTDGSINTTSTLVDTTSYLSISTYTGTGSNATIGHGLGVKPEFFMVKQLGSAGTDWMVYHSALGATKNLVLNSSASNSTTADRWNNTEPTSSLISLGTTSAVNGSSATYICYAFAPSQFISIGSYVNNNNANGPFVPTVNSLGIPIQPTWIIAKPLASASWIIFDNKRIGYNVDNNNLLADTTVVENTADKVDIVTGGFKLRTNLDPNYVTSTTVYMAIGTPIIDTDGRIIAGR